MATIIPHTDPQIFYHGRWDASRTGWWSVHIHSYIIDLLPKCRAGAGFKLHIRNLRSFSLNLGPNTSKPFVDLAVSVNYSAFVPIRASAGSNVVPLGDDSETSVVRINVQRENNRIQLESIILNAVRCLHISSSTPTVLSK